MSVGVLMSFQNKGAIYKGLLPDKSESISGVFAHLGDISCDVAAMTENLCDLPENDIGSL